VRCRSAKTTTLNMRALVIHCHPVDTSYSSALCAASVKGLRDAGHDVDVIDLTARDFDPVMSTAEWRSYVSMSGDVPADLVGDVELVKSAETLVFVYPTWWSAAPAQLKGWVERVFRPGVAFVLDDNKKVAPALGKLRRVVTVTTFGSPRVYTMAMNDNGSRMLRRSLRLVATRRVRTTRLALFRMDRTTEHSRQKFVNRVERKMGRL
jgi:NAD(P)H dehydrogenase (quinone)